MGFFKEFKEFAVKGNVIDLAVGVIIGGAFGKITTSAVEDVIMPPIGMLLGKVEFKDLKIVFQEAVKTGDKITTTEVALKYGSFIQHVFDFAILAFCVFLMVKAINTLKKEPAPAPAPVKAPEPTKEEILLTEIRDALRAK